MNNGTRARIWNIDGESFPFDKSDELKVRFLLRYAILAPSAHNTQPWKCRIDDAILHVYYDLDHSLPLSDPAHREAFLSLGAFITNYCEASRTYGCTPVIEWLPKGRHFDAPVATITISNFSEARLTPATSKLLSQITQRRVNRSFYTEKNIPKNILDEIVSLNDNRELKVHVIEDKKSREKIAECVRLGMEFAFKNKKFREELAEYVIPNISTRKDGIPGYTANLNLLASFILPKMMRTYDIGASQAKIEQQRFMSAPAMVVISSTTDDHSAWLQAGALFERIAFLLTEHGIAHAVSGAPIEAPMLPAKLQQIIDTDFRPQILFRIGYSYKNPPHSPRRDVSEILLG